MIYLSECIFCKQGSCQQEEITFVLEDQSLSQVEHSTWFAECSFMAMTGEASLSCY